jgi:hypothetical protein
LLNNEYIFNYAKSNYPTLLPATLSLNNNYEVGLAEITYTQSLRVSLDFITLTCENNEENKFKEILNRKF